VIVVETERGARALLDDLHAIEAEYGRTRDVRWGPRTLDLDLITYDDQRSADPNLELPHPRAHERAFVLVPWRDADPAASLPDHGSVADLLADRDPSECILLDGVRAGES
jgi:7,8-dihydro-6-hydroxymethylpterin-pyrophosphokinase